MSETMGSKAERGTVVIAPKTGVVTLKGGQVDVNISKVVSSPSGKRSLDAIARIRQKSTKSSA